MATTLTGPVFIDGYGFGGEAFYGVGDGTIQGFSLDGIPADQRILGIAVICQSTDGATLYPASTRVDVSAVTASVQVPDGVDFSLFISYTYCS